MSNYNIEKNPNSKYYYSKWINKDFSKDHSFNIQVLKDLFERLLLDHKLNIIPDDLFLVGYSPNIRITNSSDCKASQIEWC